MEAILPQMLEIGPSGPIVFNKARFIAESSVSQDGDSRAPRGLAEPNKLYFILLHIPAFSNSGWVPVTRTAGFIYDRVAVPITEYPLGGSYPSVYLSCSASDNYNMRVTLEGGSFPVGTYIICRWYEVCNVN